jgi:hypothetical protein
MDQLSPVCAEVAALATFDDLTADQSYGRACVVCGAYFLDRALDSVPAGLSALGGKVFACPDCAAKPVEAGGLGMDPDNGWQGSRP